MLFDLTIIIFLIGCATTFVLIAGCVVFAIMWFKEQWDLRDRGEGDDRL